MDSAHKSNALTARDINSLLRTFVIHVRGNTARRKHTDQQLLKRRLKAAYVLDGNKEDIDEATLERYFAGDMRQAGAATSCALKHIYAYETIVREQIPLALILEDDIVLYNNFTEVTARSIEEIRARSLSNILVSYEDSLLEYVAHSQKQKGQLLYRQDHGRMAGAYLVDTAAAAAMLVRLQKKKMDVPVDFFHVACARQGIINVLWCEPPVAVQASCAGGINSLIDNKRSGILPGIIFRLNRRYKKLLYRLR